MDHKSIQCDKVKEKLILVGGGGHSRACIDVVESSDVFQIAGIVDVPDKIDQQISGCGKLPVIISKFAYVSQNAYVDEGSIVMHYAMINAGAKIGKNCIINSKALVEHDTAVEDTCHISTGAIINGGCDILENTFVGSRVIVKECVRIGRSSIVGAGSVVINDVPEKSLAVGVPARCFKKCRSCRLSKNKHKKQI